MNSSPKTKSLRTSCTGVFLICTCNNANSYKPSSHIMVTYIYDRVNVLINNSRLLCVIPEDFCFLFVCFSFPLALSFSPAIF